MSLADYYLEEYFSEILCLEANNVTKSMIKDCLDYLIDDTMYETRFHKFYFDYNDYFVTTFLEKLQIGNKIIDEVNLKNTLRMFKIT